MKAKVTVTPVRGGRGFTGKDNGPGCANSQDRNGEVTDSPARHLHITKEWRFFQMALVSLSPKVMHVMGEIDRVSVDMNVTRMLRARRDEILDAIGGRTIEPTAAVLEELVQLDQALGIEPLQFPDPDAAISDLRAELRDEEINAQELDALIVELTARGMFNDLWTTKEDMDGGEL